MRELAAEAWNTAKAGLLTSLADPQSGLRRRAATAIAEIGDRLTTDAALQHRVDTWVTDAAVFLVDRYRSDIASIITDTVERWDPAETTEKIELMVGRDLQYIRLNGTIVGALAGWRSSRSRTRCSDDAAGHTLSGARASSLSPWPPTSSSSATGRCRIPTCSSTRSDAWSRARTTSCPGYTVDYAEIDDHADRRPVSGLATHPIVRATGNSLRQSRRQGRSG